MPTLQNSPLTDSLPAELEVALRSATWRALTAFQSLRSAVRDHVYDERARGTCRTALDENLRSMIGSCGPVVGNVNYSAERTGDVTTQVLKWCAEFFRPLS